MTDEELELFPTSESALKMLSYVTPGFYDISYAVFCVCRQMDVSGHGVGI